MELTYQFMSRKMKDQWRPIFLLYGPESYLQNDFILNLKELFIDSSFEDFNFISVDYSYNYRNIIDTAEATPFMSDKQIIVIRGADKLSKSAFKRFCAYAQRPVQSTCLIFQTSVLPTKRKRVILSNDLDQIVKKFGDAILFRESNDKEAFQFLRDRSDSLSIQIEDKAIERCIDFVGTDLWKLTSALDKVSMYCLGKTITSRDIKKVLIDNAPVTFYDLTEAILNQKQSKALVTLSKLFERNEPLLIFGAIVRQWRFLRQAKLLVKSNLFSTRYEHIERDKYSLDATLASQFGDDSILAQHKFVIFKTIQAADKISDEAIMRGVYEFTIADAKLKGIGCAKQNGYSVLYELVRGLTAEENKERR